MREAILWTIRIIEMKTTPAILIVCLLYTSTGLPNSNVLYYELSDGAWCCVRPSGTEPKIKFYFGVKGDSFESSKEQLQELEDALMKKFK